MSKLVSQLKLFKDNETIDMNTIIEKLQDVSRNRRFNKWSRKDCKVTFTFTSHKYRKWAHFSALKHVKTYLRSTMGNNRLHTLMLIHVHKNILDNINLAYVANEFVDRRDRRKQTFGHFSQNDS